MKYLLKGLESYFPCELSFKAKACNVPLYEKPRSLKVRRYSTCLIDFNEYLASFRGATMADKMGVTELNEILSNSMPNICYDSVLDSYEEQEFWID